MKASSDFPLSSSRASSLLSIFIALAGGPAFPPCFSSHSGTAGAPSLRCLQGRVAMLPVLFGVMSSGLHGSYGAHHLHFIPCSCYDDSLFYAAGAAAIA